MDVRCERCRAQYVFDDEQVTPAGLTVQCTNCGHVFRVKKKELVVTVPVKPDELDAAPVPASSVGPKPPGSTTVTMGSASHDPERAREGGRDVPREWRVRQANGNTFTFRELTTLQKWIIEQKVARDDEISLSGDQWKRLGNIAELASFFQVVEAAERGKAAQQAVPAVTPLPMSMPVYGIALQAPGPYATYPGAQPSPQPAAPPPEYRPAPVDARPEPLAIPPSAPAPTVEVDLGPEELASVKKGRGGRIVLALLVLAAAGAGAWWYLGPRGALGDLFGAAKPAPADPAAVAVPLTIEVKPDAAPPEAAPPAPVPVPAPEPVVERTVEPPPEQIAKAQPKAPPAPRGPKAMLAQAARLREKGDFERALDLYGRVADAEPENVAALTGRGLCYLDLETYPPAEASFLAALGIAPDEPGALLGLAETYRWQGKTADAIRYYEKYLAKHPGGEEADVARNALEELRR